LQNVANASRGNDKPQINSRDIMNRNITLYGLALPLTPMPLQRKAQQGMLDWLAGGKRIHAVAAQFPLQQTAEAHLAVEAGTKQGTVVVDCAR